VSIRLFDGVDPHIGTEVPTHRMSDCIGNLSADYNNEVRRSSAHRRPDITIPARSQNRFIGRSPSKPIATLNGFTFFFTFEQKPSRPFFLLFER